MKCLILAAGYATRLYPLTKDFPKPLLKVGDKTILDWLVDDLSSCCEVDSFYVVTNSRFAGHFSSWAKSRPEEVAVLDDGTDTNETRLGAVRDIQFAVKAAGIDDDLMVMAGDNVLDFSLGSFVSYAAAKETSCILRYFEPDDARLHKSGIVEVSADDTVISMEEKPQNPRSHWCCPPFYYIKASDLRLLDKALAEGCGYDAPGSFAAWLSEASIVHAMEMPGHRYDIGNIESYRSVCESYRGILK